MIVNMQVSVEATALERRDIQHVSRVLISVTSSKHTGK